ncbi:pre-mRNA cleavage factor Im 25 kDa subunit 1 isoform X2 [Vigna radiata var. radiata]|uniref:Pre-mRNA cleavage factor Im 25 kDa subunit 1 isoform X2 n=1 Tax=Vigna radiata var. radiata TaxID=3916 RepID=A0A3Q0EYD8_VIGRR|nr:pre-mRNA cleavage factor Im 25 kDa subunit 1 isoform X2 [Vigna radiata var. radiata]
MPFPSKTTLYIITFSGSNPTMLPVDYELLWRLSYWLLYQVELFKHPHLLLLQVRNSIYKLPGGRLRPGESDTDGLKRKLTRKLSVDEDGDGSEWEVGECLGMWWRPDFETLLYPFLPPNVKQPKECTKVFLVKLPASRKFIVPKNMRLLAVPLCQVHENQKTYGQIISGVPQLLSKFSFNMLES